MNRGRQFTNCVEVWRTLSRGQGSATGKDLFLAAKWTHVFALSSKEYAKANAVGFADFEARFAGIQRVGPKFRGPIIGDAKTLFILPSIFAAGQTVLAALAFYEAVATRSAMLGSRLQIDTEGSVTGLAKDWRESRHHGILCARVLQ